MSEVCNLAILEYLIQSNGYMRSSHLWSALFSKFQHCPAMLSVIGPNPDAMEEFVRHQPALFRVSNGFIYSGCDLEPKPIQSAPPLTRKHSFELSENFEKLSSSNLSSSIKPEMEAVRYFKEYLLRKTDKWVPIKSLSAHLSQASSIVRMVVGSPNEIINFLILYPNHFEISGNLVGLADRFNNTKNDSSVPSTRQRKPRPLSYHHSVDESRQLNFLERCALPIKIPGSSSSIPGNPIITVPSNTNTVALNLDECKALIWLTNAIKTAHNNSLPLSSLLNSLSNAPKAVHSSIGWTQIELVEFLKKYDRVFRFSEKDQLVKVSGLANTELLIVKKVWNSENSHILLAQKGCIFCVNRLWGIIDLGFHEHVFFDRSLFKHVTDLSNHFKVRDTVFFNAVLASKESRAKWRATCVWKETDHLANHLKRLSLDSPHVEDTEEMIDDTDSGLDNSEDSALKEQFEDVEEAFDTCSRLFAGIRLADAWELQSNQDKVVSNDDGHVNPSSSHVPVGPDEGGKASVELQCRTDSPMSESSTLSGIPSITDGANSVGNRSAVRLDQPIADNIKSSCCACGGSFKSKTSISMATQTLFTGDIMATKLYHDDSSH